METCHKMIHLDPQLSRHPNHRGFEGVCDAATNGDYDDTGHLLARLCHSDISIVYCDYRAPFEHLAPLGSMHSLGCATFL